MLWYIGLEAEVLLASPAKVDPESPQNLQPSEIDIAIGMQKIEEMTILNIRRPIRRWATCALIVGDGSPAAGFDLDITDLFWLAGHYGYGIHTAPALGRAATVLARHNGLPPEIVARSITVEHLSVSRLRKVISV